MLPVGIMIKWIRFVCGYLSIAVSLSLNSACIVLMINEAKILLWQTVVTLIWSTTATMDGMTPAVRQLTHAIVQSVIRSVFRRLLFAVYCYDCNDCCQALA